ncbi:MAG: thiamine monophosphate synthase [Candidatus Marinimicrobia bacterium]|nr:thiamine monophosphate synthase [Candidatus Neomarinimicrobiota bacterium]RPG05996.1 MAG: thiamine phosphate synthase [Pelagibacteraceae bacterium TMED247]|tara:strand:- start:7575 stop:8150 length:576 start_codon:yes stop_codon:yes gene_type:complete
MFINKNKYYIYIESLRSINIDLIKTKSKFNLIYRNNLKKENTNKIIKFIKLCKKKYIKFFVLNDLSLALKIGADGVYLPSYNKALLKKKELVGKKIEVIGSAHNFKEINIKKKQGCKEVVLSRLFETDYKDKKSFFGITRFNLLTKNYKNDFIALGGIRSNNLMKIKMLNCEGIALLSEAKKKPAIIRRLL